MSIGIRMMCMSLCLLKMCINNEPYWGCGRSSSLIVPNPEDTSDRGYLHSFLKMGPDVAQYQYPEIPTTMKTMGVNITTIAYLRVLIIEIGSTIILMAVEAEGICLSLKRKGSLIRLRLDLDLDSLFKARIVRTARDADTPAEQKNCSAEGCFLVVGLMKERIRTYPLLYKNLFFVKPRNGSPNILTNYKVDWGTVSQSCHKKGCAWYMDKIPGWIEVIITTRAIHPIYQTASHVHPRGRAPATWQRCKGSQKEDSRVGFKGKDYQLLTSSLIILHHRSPLRHEDQPLQNKGIKEHSQHLAAF